MYAQITSPHKTLHQPALDETFELFNLTPKRKFLFRQLAKELNERIEVIRRPLTSFPTRKRNEERSHLLRYADIREKALRIVEELLLMDEGGRLQPYLKWLDSGNKILWLAANAESMKRHSVPISDVYCSAEDGNKSLTWAMNVIDKKFVGGYESERELRVRKLIVAGHYNYFPTLPPVTRVIFDHLPKLEDEDVFLEPSAGTGDLALETIRLYKAMHGITVYADCIEPNWSLFDVLSERTTNLTPYHADFMDFIPSQSYKLVLMNPPFADFLAHVKRAYKFVVPGGVLVSVMPRDFERKTQKDVQRFFKMAEQNNVRLYRLPKDSFAISGTNVQTSLMVLLKGEFD